MQENSQGTELPVSISSVNIIRAGSASSAQEKDPCCSGIDENVFSLGCRHFYDVWSWCILRCAPHSVPDSMHWTTKVISNFWLYPIKFQHYSELLHIGFVLTPVLLGGHWIVSLSPIAISFSDFFARIFGSSSHYWSSQTLLYSTIAPNYLEKRFFFEDCLNSLRGRPNIQYLRMFSEENGLFNPEPSIGS